MYCHKTYVPYKGPALPGNAEAIVLFSSVTAFGIDAAPHYHINWVDVALRLDQNADNTVKVQKSSDGTTWVDVDSKTVSSVGDSVDPDSISFFVGVFKNFRVVYTNGVTPQTAFAVDLTLNGERSPNE
ncbi:MAG: hypothetical protein EHM35_02630 [Planctomycetaceae bacterium]|nr:MAG: hypothetical protein EHM35_02630 [Planctomycetaceae bacterium]